MSHVSDNNGKKYNIVDLMIKTMNVIATRTCFIFSVVVPSYNCFDLLIAINIARGKKSFP